MNYTTLTFQHLCFLNGLTEEQANIIGITRSELITNLVKIAAYFSLVARKCKNGAQDYVLIRFYN